MINGEKLHRRSGNYYYTPDLFKPHSKLRHGDKVIIYKDNPDDDSFNDKLLGMVGTINMFTYDLEDMFPKDPSIEVSFNKKIDIEFDSSERKFWKEELIHIKDAI